MCENCGCVEESRIIRIEQDVLGRNATLAARNRARFSEGGVLALNMVSSPGSGKTTLLARTAAAQFPMAVIEGDQQTDIDAERIRAAGVAAVQVNTGKGCHLDAHGVGHAAESLGLARGTVLFIENVGNLVCPAAFDLGEAHKVVILSVTEGDDKPLKYPHMFAASDLMIVNKIDLLAYVDFNVERCVDCAQRANPKLEFLKLSATTGEGLKDWFAWIETQRQAIVAPA